MRAEVQAGNGVRGSAEADLPLMQVLPGEQIDNEEIARREEEAK